jgi:hypothetical protein
MFKVCHYLFLLRWKDYHISHILINLTSVNQNNDIIGCTVYSNSHSAVFLISSLFSCLARTEEREQTTSADDTIHLNNIQ